jgi:hypothetical protein
MAYQIVHRDSTLYSTALDLYVRHYPDAGNWCPRCERLHCPIRDHAAEVIQAGGIDPDCFDHQTKRSPSVWWVQHPTAVLPTVQEGSYGAT